MSVHVKHTGLTRAEEVEAVVAAGVDYIAFVLSGGAARVTLEDASALALAARGAGFEGGLVGVVADADPDLLTRAAVACDLDVLQLDGEESSEAVRAAAAVRPVWKTLRIDADTTPAALEVMAAASEVAEAIVLDVGALMLAGGAGSVVAHAAVAELVRVRHVIVGGGLDASNVGEIVRGLDPFGVDVRGDGGGVERFVSAVREAERTA